MRAMYLVLIAALASLTVSAANAEPMPRNMRGSWSMGDENGMHERVPENQGDFYVGRHKLGGVDSECTIKHVQRMAKDKYAVFSHCWIADSDTPPTEEADVFELIGKELHVYKIE
jgi:hypothetical protein